MYSMSLTDVLLFHSFWVTLYVMANNFKLFRKKRTLFSIVTEASQQIYDICEKLYADKVLLQHCGNIFYKTSFPPQHTLLSVGHSGCQSPGCITSSWALTTVHKPGRIQAVLCMWMRYTLKAVLGYHVYYLLYLTVNLYIVLKSTFI